MGPGRFRRRRLRRDPTGGRNADSLTEAVGSDTTIQTAIQGASVGDSVSIAGVPTSIILDLPVMHLFVAQVALKSALCSVERELRTLIPLVEHGRIHQSGWCPTISVSVTAQRPTKCSPIASPARPRWFSPSHNAERASRSAIAAAERSAITVNIRSPRALGFAALAPNTVTIGA